MKVLMFGWEFPPKIYGGLAVASYGITKGMVEGQPDAQITFCLPKPCGEEEKFLRIIGMNQVPIVYRGHDYNYVKSRIPDYMTPEEYYNFRDHIYADFSYMNVNDMGCMEFAGGYPGNLHDEINNFSIIAGVVARAEQFDIIHAHDWLTYPAGVHAKMVSGKPLCIHVHATDFDRSRGKVNPTVYSIEKNGMDHADCIMCVSELTRQTVINQYHQDPRKCFTVHNAVYPLPQEYQDILRISASALQVPVTSTGRWLTSLLPKVLPTVSTSLVSNEASRYMNATKLPMCLSCHPCQNHLALHHWKRCSVAHHPSSPSSLVVARFSTRSSRWTIGTSTLWQMPSILSAPTRVCTPICVMKVSRKWQRSLG